MVEIISKAMNPTEGRLAQATLNFHFSCKENGLDDGRTYYAVEKEKSIVGVVGLHQYPWGPDENVWLGWFAVKPEHQRQGIGTWLMNKIIEEARQKGYKKMLVETYSGKDFESARSFYSKFGFKRIGKIKKYMGKEDMIVFSKEI